VGGGAGEGGGKKIPRGRGGGGTRGTGDFALRPPDLTIRGLNCKT